MENALDSIGKIITTDNHSVFYEIVDGHPVCPYGDKYDDGWSIPWKQFCNLLDLGAFELTDDPEILDGEISVGQTFLIRY